MPNRRRRRLSTATSAVAALAVVSPFAVSALTDLTKPAPQPREFRQAAMVTDLPNELMSALSQGLSQFGINLPSTAGLTGAGASTPSTLTAPGGLTSPLTSPALTPGLASPAAAPGVTSPALTPGLATPAARHCSGGSRYGGDRSGGDGQSRADQPGSRGNDGAAAAPNPALNPTLTSPTGATPGGLTTPPVTGVDPALATTPISNAAGLPAPGEVPISAPIGLEPAAGGLGGTSYPILGGDSLAADACGDEYRWWWRPDE